MDAIWTQRIREHLAWPAEGVDRGKSRFEGLFSDAGGDYLPILFEVPVPQMDGIPRFNYREAFYDPDKMAANELRAVMGMLRSGSDAQPSIRANTGTGTVASVFGLEQEILPDAMPWLKQHLGKDALAKLEPIDEVAETSLMVHIRKIIEFYQTHLPELPVYVFDTQGPFDLAHLVRGDEIFVDLHDDPPFVHHLMTLVTAAYVKATEYAKGLVGEPPDRAYHSRLYLSAAGVRLCEDTTTLIGERELEEFVLPYSNQVMEHFGGGFVHYCGRNDPLFDAVIERMPQCRYLNLGNPDMHDATEVIRRVSAAGKVYVGGPVRENGESLEAYFRRTLSALEGKRRGLALAPSLNEEEAAEPEKAIDLYHRLQDEILEA